MKMLPWRKLLVAISAMIPLAIAACADPTGPAAASRDSTSLERKDLLGLSLISKHAVEWSDRHVDGSYSVSGVIGSQGGSLAIPAADFTITFAPGAISSATRITVTAVSGHYVAYDMQPHGIRFAAPVTVSQGLRNTAAYSSLNLLSTLAGVYINNDDPPAADGTITPTEILKSTTYLVGNIFGLLLADRQTWQLNHFSRYMLASG